MSYAKLVCTSNRNLKRVFTRKSKATLSGNDLSSGVEIVKRNARTLKDGSVVMTLAFADGRKVEVTYKDVV